MDIFVKARRMEVSDRFRSHVEDKLAKVMDNVVVEVVDDRGMPPEERVLRGPGERELALQALGAAACRLQIHLFAKRALDALQHVRFVIDEQYTVAHAAVFRLSRKSGFS